MATPTMAMSSPNAFIPIPSKANLPYGLPIVDDCTTCKLRNTSFFCSLSKPAMDALDRLKHATAYPEGAIVFMEGQASRGVYIVCQGRVKLMTTNSDGKTLILKIAQPGEILGLHSVMGNRPHEVTVETLQPSQLAFISRDAFLNFIKEHQDACMNAAEQISRDCHSAYSLVRSIGLCHSVSEKLARLLLEWAAEGRVSDGMVRVKLTLTHEEIAQLIGSSRETVTRTLSDFKRQNLIELHGAALLIRNMAGLTRLCES
jgi:CRP/FNR family cyclic AMP-dependent transcriptional regulator